jgi:hypothetical protein
MVRGMTNKGEKDTSSENSQTSVIKAISNLNLTLYTERGIRRVDVEREHAKWRMVHSGYKEKEAGRPPIGRGK